MPQELPTVDDIEWITDGYVTVDTDAAVDALCVTFVGRLHSAQVIAISDEPISTAMMVVK